MVPKEFLRVPNSNSNFYEFQRVYRPERKHFTASKSQQKHLNNRNQASKNNSYRKQRCKIIKHILCVELCTLDRIDRVPDELQTEVRDIVQETGIKTIPMEKKCKKEKWLSWEALQIAVKRKEVKSKGEKERYTHLNAEFQRITRRDKKAFLSDQCKEIEENNRMGKTRDLFKKIRDTKGPFHAKMSQIKDRNGLDLTEDSKKRWQEYTDELYKKYLHDPDNNDGVITHLEPDPGM